ncbi:MAG: Asp-tRNA(Asn)/Glu-tRNA(Gln) amidotransferase subunit GatC [Hyphomicrobiales bacterium]|nr:Asp-tRNA(Asn)/Glu-tRNA(Gln) amidotransferase subunit GatC [Hyphomicrobiales bacterium]
MAVDKDTVKRVARLARIALDDEEAEALKGDLNAILGFVEQLNEVDITGIDPMTSVVVMEMKKRNDVVTARDESERVLANAPVREDSFFVVPKVVE